MAATRYDDGSPLRHSDVLAAFTPRTSQATSTTPMRFVGVNMDNLSRLYSCKPRSIVTAADEDEGEEERDVDAPPPSPPPSPEDDAEASPAPFFTSRDGRWVESPVSPIPDVDDQRELSSARLHHLGSVRQETTRARGGHPSLTFTEQMQLAAAADDDDDDDSTPLSPSPPSSPSLDNISNRIREAEMEAEAFGAEMAHLRRAMEEQREGDRGGGEEMHSCMHELMADAETLVIEALRVRDQATAERDEVAAVQVENPVDP
jgi:hypothetical protein